MIRVSGPVSENLGPCWSVFWLVLYKGVTRQLPGKVETFAMRSAMKTSGVGFAPNNPSIPGKICP